MESRKRKNVMQTATIKRMDDEYHQEPIVVLPGTGEQLNIAGAKTLQKIKSDATNGVFSVMEFITPPGKGVALHVHEHEDELVYLLEGEIEVTLGTQKMKAIPGVMALLPRGIPHGFTNVGTKPSRLLDTIIPGQFDNYFVELAALYAAGDPPEEKVDALCRKYKIKYL